MAAPPTIRKNRVSRLLLRVAVVLVAAHLTASAGLYWAMTRPPDFFGRVMAHVPLPMMLVLPFETLWMHARAGALLPGGEAPDFRLPTLDGREMVQLSSFRGVRPVVLVFGSYT